MALCIRQQKTYEADGFCYCHSFSKARSAFMKVSSPQIFQRGIRREKGLEKEITIVPSHVMASRPQITFFRRYRQDAR